MTELHEELEVLRQLNDLRYRARELREQGLRPLKNIENIENIKETKTPEEVIVPKPVPKNEEAQKANGEGKDNISYKKWCASRNEVEVALLVKVQNHRDISDEEEENNKADSTEELNKHLKRMKINNFFLQEDTSSKLDAQSTVPVLTAARVMQALVSRSATVMSEQTMYCYYRILRELNSAAAPDWTFGAARAGKDSGTSAFITGECVRAILGLDNAIKNTIEFLEIILRLYEKYQQLKAMIKSLGKEGEVITHPLRKWADHAIERMWLDCYITTNPRSSQIVLHIEETENCREALEKAGFKFKAQAEQDIANKASGENLLLLKKGDKANMDTVGEYFDSLPLNLTCALINLQGSIKTASAKIKKFRKDKESPYANDKETILKKDYEKNKDKPEYKEKRADFERTRSAHSQALQVIEEALRVADKAVEEAKEAVKEENNSKEEESKFLENIFNKLIEKGEGLSRVSVKQVLDPIRQYIKTVIRRELAASPSAFDAGELVFAATAFGALTDWKENELLTQACESLIKALPESGILSSKRPLHSTQHGYRMLPIGCEMTRCLAHLFQKFNYEVEPKIVGRMLHIFEEKKIRLYESSKKRKLIGWNFDGSPNPDKSCVWVTAVSVMALDRIVRMLDSRINNAVLKHFEVIKPDRSHSDLTLNELIYTDYGMRAYLFKQEEQNENELAKRYKDQRAIPIYLEQMRAHVMRAKLPDKYEEKVFSAIFYGPPGTGKTTLAEAMALSSQVPVVSLSPSDLMVQGQQLIEGRARDVFEAVSMLTQAVIILDEFEPVLKTRDGNEASESTEKLSPNQKLLAKIAEELKEIGKKDDPTFKFLLAGMLPKLLKLHDTAKRQSLVYCLATNYLKDIDEAAKRRGRFDSKMPVYNPCPLSRAGTFLFRLSQVEKTDGQELDLTDSGQLKRFINVIRATANEPASELSREYFEVKEKDNKIEKVSDYFDYVLNLESKEETKNTLELNISNRREELKEELKDKTKLEEFEKHERNWLNEFEKQLFTDEDDLAKLLREPKEDKETDPKEDK